MHGHALSKFIYVPVLPNVDRCNTVFAFVEIPSQVFKIGDLHIGNQEDIRQTICLNGLNTVQ